MYLLLAFISNFLDHLAECEQAAVDVATFFETRACYVVKYEWI